MTLAESMQMDMEDRLEAIWQFLKAANAQKCAPYDWSFAASERFKALSDAFEGDVKL